MEIWIEDELTQWTKWRDAARAATPPASVLILTRDAGRCALQDVLAAVRLARRLAPEPLAVLAGCAHPTHEWRAAVRRAGADRVFLVSAEAVENASPMDGAVEIPADVCPALHAIHEPAATLSVCGQHGDRMVVVRRHLERWCLGKHAECPYWSGHSVE